MKRSGNVGLALMGGAAFVATFAAGTAYFAWQKPSHAAQAATQQQNCTPRPDGTQNCQPVRHGFAYYLYPHSGYFSGWSFGTSRSVESKSMQSVALTNGSRSVAPHARGGAMRSGFGSTGHAMASHSSGS